MGLFAFSWLVSRRKPANPVSKHSRSCSLYLWPKTIPHVECKKSVKVPLYLLEPTPVHKLLHLIIQNKYGSRTSAPKHVR
jgi:hypothetical protein